ncbi:hypothetical protein PXK56_18235 [Phaeobacter gallaeciensis]|uniref:hypothetical protein n=1 Tax=Phaeobacter gallaeciensis TaxID=60890 RepID=UPI002380010A|nr:hypothetical protein [Phaeobacter gallaeciensis]MDE4297126.1 hypothetical protein [Phaeobacter gallaeciensis]
MTTVTVSLINGVERSTAHPTTFEVPNEEDRETIQVGDHVKIGLESAAAGGERFWVRITEVRIEQDQFLYAGAVDNDLIIYDIPLGEILEFDPEHVLSIIRNKERTIQ